MKPVRRRLVGIGIGLALLPMSILFVTASVAFLAGCEVDEVGAHPCVVSGIDIGGYLSRMLDFGWLGLLTIPLAMLFAAVWLMIEAAIYLRRRSKMLALARHRSGA